MDSWSNKGIEMHDTTSIYKMCKTCLDCNDMRQQHSL